MFTGIVQGAATVAQLTDHRALRHLVLDLPEGLGDGLVIGASVAVGGVCLTVTEVDADRVHFDVIDETLRRTTLGTLREGSRVNVERAARFGDEIGGHVLSGHIWGTAQITDIHSTQNNRRLTLRAPESAAPFLMPKGYVGLEGCSLTLGRVDTASCTFDVHLIPETLRITTLGAAVPGTHLNLELDAMTQAVVTTVERVLAARS
ncbi:MAG: riboflavin synthase subunit alpha [Deltaproteobacteria bacterium]|nr:MAG: riboflavin synthase subunit alpha [Deltaproteobacteria bacterium]